MLGWNVLTPPCIPGRELSPFFFLSIIFFFLSLCSALCCSQNTANINRPPIPLDPFFSFRGVPLSLTHWFSSCHPHPSFLSLTLECNHPFLSSSPVTHVPRPSSNVCPGAAGYRPPTPLFLRLVPLFFRWTTPPICVRLPLHTPILLKMTDSGAS